MKNSFLVIVALNLLFSACTKQAVEPDNSTKPVSSVTSSFDLIQDKIFTPSCATSGCHLATTDASFAQHGLVLAKSTAYSQLVGVVAKNPNAVINKILRVTKFQSTQSLLYHKLNWDVAHHSSIDYGVPMPLGGKPLSVGQLKFIQNWIEAGAPEKGEVADAKLLDDTTPSYAVSSDFSPLNEPSAEGKEGLQLKVDKFSVAPNFERELFVRKPLNNSTPIYVTRIKLKSRPNSHHMVLYDFENKQSLPNLNEVRDLRNSDNSINVFTFLQMQNHIFLGGGTDPNSDYSFPEGTALLLPANSSIDLNPHYFNKTNEVIFGENYVNLYTVKADQVKKVVQMIDFNNTNLTIPANQKTVISKDFIFDKAVAIVSLTSHTHQWGKLFQIKIKGGARNGEVIYESTDWAHPTVINFSKVIELKAGEGLTSVVTYDNNTNRIIRFGLTSEDEMNIIFGYYYAL